LITAILVFSTFFLGGAIMCFGTGVRHSILAKKAKTNPAQTVEPQT